MYRGQLENLANEIPRKSEGGKISKAKLSEIFKIYSYHRYDKTVDAGSMHCKCTVPVLSADVQAMEHIIGWCPCPCIP
jgi:hypothetical protein